MLNMHEVQAIRFEKVRDGFVLSNMREGMICAISIELVLQLEAMSRSGELWPFKLQEINEVWPEPNFLVYRLVPWTN